MAAPPAGTSQAPARVHYNCGLSIAQVTARTDMASWCRPAGRTTQLGPHRSAAALLPAPSAARTAARTPSRPTVSSAARPQVRCLPALAFQRPGMLLRTHGSIELPARGALLHLRRCLARQCARWCEAHVLEVTVASSTDESLSATFKTCCRPALFEAHPCQVGLANPAWHAASDWPRHSTPHQQCHPLSDFECSSR